MTQAVSTSTDNSVLSVVSSALNIAEEVANALGAVGVPIASAVATGIKIAQGVVAEVPEAQALYNQFQSGTIPSAADIAAYTSAEDSSYAKLMNDINNFKPA